MIDYVSPRSGKKLTQHHDMLTSDAGEKFPVVNDIPRFTGAENYAGAFGFQWNTFSKTQLDSVSHYSISKDRLERNFGASLDVLKNKNVLEAGCGAGRFTELLVAAGASVHAFDLSSAVEANRQNIGEQANYRIAQASIYEIPYPDDAFDYVLCIGVLQHTPSPEKSIEHLWKKVKPGGWLVIDHYRLLTSYFFKLKPAWRYFLKRMNPQKAMRVVNRLHHFFFPMHWRLRNYPLTRKFLYRISPLTDHLDDLPHLDFNAQSEWSRLDSYDSLTDYYKHLRTPRQIRKMLERTGAKEIYINTKGTRAVEARAKK